MGASIPSIVMPEETGGSSCSSDSDTQVFEDPSKMYMADTMHLPRRDIMLVQIISPYADLPWTLVIHTFSRVGYKPLFTSLFYSDDWGNRYSDEEFLAHLWKQLGLEGPFNLAALFYDAIPPNMPPGGLSALAVAPQIYRRPIHEVGRWVASFQECETHVVTQQTQTRPSQSDDSESFETIPLLDETVSCGSEPEEDSERE